MIKKQYRFHGYNSLQSVYRRGKTVRGPLTSLKYMRNDRRQHYRLAVVVSKKVHKSAVKRNRIRRRLYEAVRLLEPRITQPYDIVLTVFHENVATIPAEEVRKLVFTQLKQAGIIDPSRKSTTAIQKPNKDT
jgi:ribonuclease P protein component